MSTLTRIIFVLSLFLLAMPLSASDEDRLPKGMKWQESIKDRRGNLSIAQAPITTSALHLIDESGQTLGILSASKGHVSLSFYDDTGILAVDLGNGTPSRAPSLDLYKDGRHVGLQLDDLPLRMEKRK